MGASYTPDQVLLQTYNQPRTTGRNGSVIGTVSGVDYPPYATMQIVGAKYSTPRFATPDLNGNFYFAGLLPDTYTVSAVSNIQYNFSPSSVMVNLQPGNYAIGNFTGTYSGLYFNANPTLLSSFANPRAGLSGDWAVGMTVKPTSGLGWKPPDLTVECIVACGNYGAANAWTIGLGQGPNALVRTIDVSAVSTQGPVLTGYNLIGLEPGQRNIAIGVQGGTGTILVDGLTYWSGAAANVTQGATITIGKYGDNSYPMSHWTLSNLKFDTNIAKVTSNNRNPGPSGQAQCAVFGDSISAGAGITSYGPGPYGSQLADNRLGSEWWWSTAVYGGTTSFATPYWTNWGSYQGLTKATVFLGINDIVTGGVGAGTSAWNNLKAILDGMRSAGLNKIALFNISPFGSSGYWNPSEENERGILNSYITNYASTYSSVVKLVDAATLLAGSPAINLNPAYDGGDGLHINQAGHNVLYSAVSSVL